MFFAMYVGPAIGEWRENVEAHAQWLGLLPAFAQHGALNCVRLSVHGNVPHLKKIGDTLWVTTMAPTAIGDGVNAGDGHGSDIGGNDVAISYNPTEFKVQLSAPPATPEQIVFRRHGREFHLTNDLRLLARTGTADLDAAAIYSLFQYGAIPAPLTALLGVQRAPTAHTTSIDLRTGSVTAVPQRLEPRAGDLPRFEDRLDQLLDQAPKGSVLTFSGGVDSGLLAARFAALGRRDITLFNYSFAPDDPEAELAAAMARQLDLTLEQATYQPAALCHMLAEIGRDYSYPFGDFATMPANMLVRAGAEATPDAPIFIDGTGADGAFGINVLPTWQRLYGLPVPLRAAISKTYSLARSWSRVSRFEDRCRVIRRSVQMPLLEAAVIATNSLDGVLYRIPRTVRSRLSDVIHERIIAVAPSADIRDQYSWLDLAHVCAGEYAAKSFDPLRRRGIRAAFPYLEPSLLREAFGMPWDAKHPRGVAKLPLKTSLARYVGHEMVYRPKSGFVPPLDRWLTEDPLRGVLSDVAADLGPLSQYINERRFRDVVGRAIRGHPLSQGVKNFVWVVSFTKLWLDQQPWFSA